jgi:hypothetical protein
MTDIVLRDIDSALADRIRLLADAQGWETGETLRRALDLGLQACENSAAIRLAEHESAVLQSAIVALEQAPNDPGFAMIGRAEPTPSAAEGPDQSVAASFSLE